MSIFLLNFKKQFAPQVEKGEKRQTIRRRRKDGRCPVPGDTVKLFTGLRTSGVRLMRIETVTECLVVHMHMEDAVIVIDGKKLNYIQSLDFAAADGFATVGDMLRWFRDQYETTNFEGFCVRWTPTNNHGQRARCGSHYPPIF